MKWIKLNGVTSRISNKSFLLEIFNIFCCLIFQWDISISTAYAFYIKVLILNEFTSNHDYPNHNAISKKYELICDFI